MAENDGNIVVRTKEDCAQLFFVFTGLFRQVLGMRPMEFLAKTHLVNRNLVILRDPEHTGFQQGLSGPITDLDSLVTWQRELWKSMPQVTELYYIGVSSGALPAIYSAHRLKAKTVWTFGAGPPPTKAQRWYLFMNQDKPPFNEDELDHDYIKKVIDTLAEPNGQTEYRLYYIPSNRRDSYVNSLLEHCPSTTSYAVEPPPGYEPLRGTRDWDHFVLHVLGARGELEDLFPPSLPARAPE